MSQRYFLQCSYNGSEYHGWQVQPNAASVQGVMEEALSTILRERVGVVGAGRTDTGVHASCYILHFDLERGLIPENLVYKLNSFLPSDIAVQKIWKVKKDVHARFDAVSRTYKYYISTKKDPFKKAFAFQFLRPLDLAGMNVAAAALTEYSDFTSFSRLHSDVKTNNCNVLEAIWEKEGDMLVFTIRADRFLRNMVRAIVGTLLEVGQGKMDLKGFRSVIEKKDRSEAGTSAPAQGLFLEHIEYPEEIMTTDDFLI